MGKPKRNEKLWEVVQQLIASGAESRYSIQKATKVSWAAINKFLNTKCIGKVSAVKLNKYIKELNANKVEGNVVEDTKVDADNTPVQASVDPYVSFINSLVNSERFVSAVNTLMDVESLLSGGELNTKQSEACVGILNRSLEAVKTEIAHLILEV